MAISFLEMNDQPKRYRYYERFIDKPDAEPEPQPKLPFSYEDLDLINI